MCVYAVVRSHGSCVHFNIHVQYFKIHVRVVKHNLVNCDILFDRDLKVQ